MLDAPQVYSEIRVIHKPSRCQLGKMISHEVGVDIANVLAQRVSNANPTQFALLSSSVFLYSRSSEGGTVHALHPDPGRSAVRRRSYIRRAAAQGAAVGAESAAVRRATVQRGAAGQSAIPSTRAGGGPGPCCARRFVRGRTPAGA